MPVIVKTAQQFSRKKRRNRPTLLVEARGMTPRGQAGVWEHHFGGATVAHRHVGGKWRVRHGRVVNG